MTMRLFMTEPQALASGLAGDAIVRTIPDASAFGSRRGASAFGSRRATMVVALLACIMTAPAAAQRLDEMSLDRWKELREVERYQLNIAEKYYREKDSGLPSSDVITYQGVALG